MFNLHKNHKMLVVLAFSVFVALSFGVAIVPAVQMEEYEPIPGQQDLSTAERKGLSIYISEGCVTCHTQQVRSIEMDNPWGERPSLASDYYYSKQRMDIWRQSPSLLGSERTGPDLTDIGKRQPSEQWHLAHLYNPRLVVSASIMPSYPWLFTEIDSAFVTEEDMVLPSSLVQVQKGNVLVATQEGKDLVAYLKSLQQFSFSSATPQEFIPSIVNKKTSGGTSLVEANEPYNGKALYQNNCAACHQSEGQGVKGAFPPLAGSLVVNNKSPELLVKIILMGYDARPEYGAMPGFSSRLSDEEIKALVDHERSSWGNKAPKVPLETITRIRDSITKNNPL